MTGTPGAKETPETALAKKGGEAAPLPSPNGAAPTSLLDFFKPIEVVREWGRMPGVQLIFKLRPYLSGELAAKREATLGLAAEERAPFLLEFRIRMLADTLLEVPAGLPFFPDEVEVGEPGKGEKSVKLRDRAYAYFSTRAPDGGLVFQYLVEEVIRVYWEEALPRPILPVSAS